MLMYVLVVNTIYECSFLFQSKGLEPEYQQKKGTYAFIRKLLCLPYLSAEHIVPVFVTLVDLASEHVMPLMEYVRRTWLESDVWPVHSWSVYGRSVRTNNDVEGK
ncbi:hypothetical protein DPMN_182846 [Dreissena polymorpha]|uniref:Uncharacterized protein n=1 Tax=Dreissena polymorpha TaxID=45954 RepID=A0A9D4DG55_DREPO|nr:hypothetical protein DPMN_182846 [Dreissena polymorpha]